MEDPDMNDTPRAFWHASFQRLTVGTVLVPQPGYEDRWHPQSAGRILEDRRPASALPHRDAVFLCDDPQECDNCGAHCEWLFRVEPADRIERHDLEWATRIDVLMSEGASPDDPAIAELARRYWSGESSELPTWEYLTPQATVLAVEEY